MAEQNRLDHLKIDRTNAPRRSVLPWILLAIVLVTTAAGAIYALFGREKVIEIKTLVVREASTGGAQTVLNASGYVTARRKATVSSKITGKIVEVLIEEGMKVEADQTLARLDDSNVRTSLNLAQAQLKAAKAVIEETQVRLHEAKLELTRTRQLSAENVASKSDLDRATAEVDSLKARLQRFDTDVEVAQRQVEFWQQQTADMVIRAPFAGIVVSKNAQPGEMISPVSAGGGFTRTGICTVVDMSSLEIEVDVNESYINRVQADQPVQATLDSYPSWKIPAHVIAIIPTADRQKATVRVRIGFDELDPRILPDMGVKVAFQNSDNETESQIQISIPTAAIQNQNDRAYVFVVRETTVERRAVSVTTGNNGETTLLSGIRTGERIVSDLTSFDLSDGDRVKEAKP